MAGNLKRLSVDPDRGLLLAPQDGELERCKARLTASRLNPRFQTGLARLSWLRAKLSPGQSCQSG